MALPSVIPAPQADDRVPTPERVRDLEDALQQNKQTPGRLPCAGLRITTRGELLWLMQQHEWSGEIESTEQARADLREIHLINVYLGNISLNGADLRGAHLGGANFQGASLFSVKFSEADLRRTNFSEAFLPNADLSGADLESANLRGAHLYETNLSGAFLERANLCGADLWGARLDVVTTLRDVTIDNTTRLGDVLWNGVPLTQVDWTAVDSLGDEMTVLEAEKRYRAARGRKSRTEARMRLAKICRDAERAYRTLAIALRQQGLAEPAARFHLCEQRLEREALKAERKHGQLLFSRLLNLVAGYGERPGNAVIAYLTVILSFTGIYWLITHFLETKLHRLSWDEALVLSLTSFHGRGFFPGTLPLGDWVARAGAVEAVIGLFIELVFIATFSRRFLGN